MSRASGIWTICQVFEGEALGPVEIIDGVSGSAEVFTHDSELSIRFTEDGNEKWLTYDFRYSRTPIRI
jgi:hypothetical protein